MTNSESNVPRKNLKKWQIVLIALVALLVIGQLFGSSNSETKTDSTNTVITPKETKVDIMTKRSCRDWYEVIGEGAKGIQTDAELRDGMQKVYDVARYSTDMDIVDSATRQLAAVTSGDTSAFAVAGNDFGNACKAHGQ
jgi:hypothetical protein